jgi:hypothetical protein
MKLSPLLLPLFLSSLAASKSISFFGSDTQHALNAGDLDLSVPGSNPLTFCHDTSEDILAIDYVDLEPNPPEAGKTLTIKASGTFSEDVEKGAYVNLQVKYGLIRLINQKADLCDQIKNVDLECPLKKGETILTKEVDLPREIPPVCLVSCLWSLGFVWEMRR